MESYVIYIKYYKENTMQKKLSRKPVYLKYKKTIFKYQYKVQQKCQIKLRKYNWLTSNLKCLNETNK